jgi:hypothetical protein
MKPSSRVTRNRNIGCLWSRSVWETFRSDDVLRREHHISDAEMKALERVSMLGNVMSKQDYLFILSIIRAERE